jgi:hypothetical protein
LTKTSSERAPTSSWDRDLHRAANAQELRPL